MKQTDAQEIVDCLIQTDDVFERLHAMISDVGDDEFAKPMRKSLAEISSDIYIKILLPMKRRFPSLDIKDE